MFRGEKRFAGLKCVVKMKTQLRAKVQNKQKKIGKERDFIYVVIKFVDFFGIQFNRQRLRHLLSVVRFLRVFTSFHRILRFLSRDRRHNAAQLGIRSLTHTENRF